MRTRPAAAAAARPSPSSRAPFRVGLTGTVAAGKTAVLRALARRGAAVIEADQLAREAVAPGTPAHARIRETFGPEVIAPGGAIDRAALARAAFATEDARRRLEEITHAAIGELRGRRLAALTEAGTDVVVEELPLLFEVGLAKACDLVVVVDAPRAMREARAAEARSWSPERFASVEEAQLPAVEKRRRADRVLDNAAGLAELEAQVDSLWDDIRRAAARRPAHA